MGYRKVNEELLWNVYVRLRAGDSQRQIATMLKLDKKTINRYAEGLGKLDLPVGLSYIELFERLKAVVPLNEKPKPASGFLMSYADEIRMLIAGDNKKGKSPMKAKTAWEVVSRGHDLTGKVSYETFKRFVREHSLADA